AQLAGAVGRGDDGAEREDRAVVVLDDLGECPDGRGAAGLELGEDTTLGGDGDPGVRIVEGTKGGDDRLVVLPALHGEGALAGSRQHLDRLEVLGDLLVEADPVQARAREDDGVELVLTGADHPEAGAEVASDVTELEPESEGGQLGAAPWRPGTDDGALTELAEGEAVAGAESVTRVDPGRGGDDDEAGCGRRRQVL